MSPLEAVQACMQAYVKKDRELAESVIADDYRFSSPTDNGLDRKSYFKVCWPNSENIERFDIINSAEDGERAWVLYEGHTLDAKIFRNVELHVVREGKLVSTQVYFGWDVPHPVAKGRHETTSEHTHHGIDYLEISVANVAKAKKFYAAAFGWKFNDYGEDYAGIRGSGREVGGLTKGKVKKGGPLVVLYSNNLEDTVKRVKKAGGKIKKPIYDFPGGRRFHFNDPAGNKLGVWGT